MSEGPTVFGQIMARPTIVALAATLAGVAAQPRLVPPGTCPGPTKDVTVAASPDPDKQPSYVFVVKNRTKEPILVLSIGDGAKAELHIASFATPLRIESPKGWTGTHVFLEGSEFMHWVWSADKSVGAIGPGALASGFKVVLPPFPPSAENNVYSDGTRVGPIKITALPFRVHFSNGSCAWGHIVLRTPENIKK